MSNADPPIGLRRTGLRGRASTTRDSTWNMLAHGRKIEPPRRVIGVSLLSKKSGAMTIRVKKSTRSGHFAVRSAESSRFAYTDRPLPAKAKKTTTSR